jgi:hypothetical protein
MVLNLSIRRIFFNSIYKNDGSGIVRPDQSAIKQISGGQVDATVLSPVQRLLAGTHKTCLISGGAWQLKVNPSAELGYSLLPAISNCLARLLKSMVLDMASTISGVLLHFSDMATAKSAFFLCRQTVAIAEHTLKLNLSIVSYCTGTTLPEQARTLIFLS